MPDRIDELEAVVALLQWASCDGCGGTNYCPLCDATNEIGHREGCPVGAARPAPFEGVAFHTIRGALKARHA